LIGFLGPAPAAASAGRVQALGASCGSGFDQPNLATCRLINDRMHQAERDHPGRAPVSLVDIGALDLAAERLGKSITLIVTISGKGSMSALHGAPNGGRVCCFLSDTDYVAIADCHQRETQGCKDAKRGCVLL
jgi:hypothetical protein